jgi:hypothetical protein
LGIGQKKKKKKSGLLRDRSDTATKGNVPERNYLIK